MPEYLYQHPSSNEIVSVFQKMKDDHVFFTEEDGAVIEWKRVFTIPNASIDTKIDPYSKKEFVEKTSKSKTVGEMWERSKELSEKRAEKEGEDPVKRKYFDEYKKQNSVKHMEDTPKVIKTNQATIEF